MLTRATPGAKNNRPAVSTVAARPYAVKAHRPGMRDYVTEYRDLGRRGARGPAAWTRSFSTRQPEQSTRVRRQW